MKKAPLFTALCAFALVLNACAARNNSGFGNGGGNGSGSGNGTGSGFASGNGSGFRSGAGRALTADAKLALGTIKLEGTPQAIDAGTAAKLLPLWQLMVQLHSSSSTAPQEVQATQDAIQAAMAPAQRNAIAGMTLTTADLFSLLQSEAQASGGSSSGSRGGFGGGGGGNGGRVFFGGGPGGGGFGGGFGGGGFGGGFGGGNRTANANGNSGSSQLTPEQQAQAAQARENAISSLVENQLIRLLETKLGRQSG